MMDVSYNVGTVAAPPAAPSTEDVVAAAWATALRRTSVDRDIDFRSAGVNANRALHLLREIWLATGLELPVNALFEMPTIRRMARAIDDGSAFTAPDRVLLRDGVGAAPLFLFPGGGGYLVDLPDLAAAITHPGPLYGIPASGMDGKGPIHDRVEAEAAHAYSVIKRTQPDGPYRLLGYSNGGATALETARLIEQHGDEVVFIGMLDTGLNDHLWPLPIWIEFVARKFAAKVLETARKAVRRRPPKAVKPAAAPRRPDINPKRRGSQYTYRFRDSDRPDYPYYSPYWEAHHTPHYSRVREAAGRMKGRYRPEVYRGPVQFFTAAIVDRLTVDPRRVWPPYLPNAEWIVLPGNHLTIILGRHAQRLGREISARLAVR